MQIIIILSIIIQFLCIIYMIRILKKSRTKPAWYIIFAAFILMVLRRLFSFIHLYIFSSFEDIFIWNEISGLIISVLMFAGILYFIPLINKIQAADKLLQKSEEKYRLLFNEMLDGFALHKLVFDANDNPVDYIFIEVNPAFEKLLGVRKKDVIGKKIYKIFTDTDKFWLEKYSKVALTGIPQKIEHYSKQFNKYFSVRAFSPKKNYFATIFQDITEKKLSEKKLINSYEELETMNEELRNTGNQLMELNESLEKSILNEKEQCLRFQKKIFQNVRLFIIKDIIDNIALQWKQPLSILSLTTNLIKRKVIFPDDDKVLINELFKKTLEQLYYMSDTIDNYKDFFDVSDKKTKFSIKDSILNTVKLISDKLAHYCIKVNICFNGDDNCNHNDSVQYLEYINLCDVEEKNNNEYFLLGNKNEFEHSLLYIINYAIKLIVDNNSENLDLSKLKLKILAEKNEYKIIISVYGIALDVEKHKNLFNYNSSDIISITGDKINLYLSDIIISENFNGKIGIYNIEDGVKFIFTIPYAKRTT